jgi:hypothetical protein
VVGIGEAGIALRGSVGESSGKVDTWKPRRSWGGLTLRFV